MSALTEEGLRDRIARAIANAEHCPRFQIGAPTDAEQCDGLPWCQRCLRLAAQAVLEEIGKDAG